jgi:hypothetical protein
MPTPQLGSPSNGEKAFFKGGLRQSAPAMEGIAKPDQQKAC